MNESKTQNLYISHVFTGYEKDHWLIKVNRQDNMVEEAE